MTTTLTLTARVEPRLEADLSAFAEALEGLGELGEPVVHLLQTLPQAGGFDLDRLVAVRTDDGCVVFDSSDLLLELLAAARAGQVDRLLVEIQVHGSSRA